MRLIAAVGLAVLGLGFAAAPALGLTCMFRPFQASGERFGPGELVAHVEVLDARADRTMDVRVLRVLNGREARPIISIDVFGSLGTQQLRRDEQQIRYEHPQQLQRNEGRCQST